MNKLMLASVLFVTSLTQSAFAVDFSGHWKGPGTMLDSRGNKTPCSRIEIVIEHKADFMKVGLYQANCGIVSPDWGPYTMTLVGDKIFEDDQEIGQIQGNLMKTLSSDGGVQYAFNLRLTQTAAGPKLESYYGVRNGLGAIVIEGDLTQ